MTNTQASSLERPEEDYIRFIPLGGLDEVGMNCSLIECNGSMLMIDCGLTFPEDEYGVDIILPDWSWVMQNLDHLDGVVLTHGHEDHIGALPFFLKAVDVPVYGGYLTCAMLEAKLQEHNLDGQVELVRMKAGEAIEVGPFDLEFVHVNHSVPDAMSIALNTPLGRCIFTGDWKLDQTPIRGQVTDLQRLGALGHDGVLALFGDSTNAESPGFSTSEQVVQQGFSDLFERTPGRIIVAQFSSNIDRVSGLIELAAQHGRKVVLLGRSLLRNYGLAKGQGFLVEPDEDVIIQPHQMDDFRPDQLLVISTGSQAEPRASLTRMALGDHHMISVDAHDTVVISARQIPGNERGIQNMINNLAKRGVTVLTGSDAPIHCTGHARAEELKLMINLTRPEYLVPVHGEFRMRKRHAELGASVGVDNTRLINDGDILEFRKNGAHIIGRVPTGRQMVDAGRVGDVQDIELRDRAKLAHSGIVVAFVVMDRDNGRVSSGPDIFQRGFMGEEDISDYTRDASDYALRAINDLSENARREPAEVREALRTSIRRFFRKQIKRKPVVIPVVHEL